MSHSPTVVAAVALVMNSPPGQRIHAPKMSSELSL